MNAQNAVPGRLLRCAALALLLLPLGCGGGGDFEEPVAFEAPETTVEYEAAVEGAPSEEIEALLTQSLLIFLRQEEGAQSLAFLRRRADGDIATAQQILRSYGYYRPTITTRVEEVPPDPEAEPQEDVAEEASEETSEDEGALIEATATLVIDPGQAFTLSRHTFAIDGFAPSPAPALGPAEAYGAPIGRPAVAAEILGAEAGALQAIREQGYFYAERTDRDAVADLEEATIEVDTSFETGRIHRFGDVTIIGAPSVDTDYLLTYVPWEEGDLATRALMTEYQQALLATGLFRSGIVTIPDAPPEGEIVPVTVTVEEAPFRTVSAGVRFDTDEGPGVRGSLEHRNLLGANERLRLTLDAAADEQSIELTYRKPQFLRNKQEFTSGLELRRVEDDAFDELGATLTVGINRTLTDRWTVGGGGLIEFSSIEDDVEGDADALLFGLPAFADFDGSNDLLNPTRGGRARFNVTPFMGTFDSDFVTFLVLDATGSYYQPLDEAERWVVATRGRLGSIPSGSLGDVPQTRRLYSGGSGSVRGFAEDFVGPIGPDNDPTGGRSVFEAGVELRFPIFGDLGGVVFVDSGAVTEDPVPTFDEGLQVAAGGGFRYYSPVGPIRLDVGVPLNGRDVDDSFQLYISIGQAF